jgi:purine nucleosidase
MKLWIDTDPGVDDALALLMVLADPRVQILGLGIVGGNVGLQACLGNAAKLLQVAGRTLPVHAGADAPLLPARADDAGHVHGRDGFGDIGYRPVPAPAADLHAAVALSQASRLHPGELVLLTLGPLTNFALALHLDPGLAGRLAGWVCMGGAVSAHGNTEFPPSEFNFAFDPEAAAICFARGPAATLVDWELVQRHGVPLAQFDAWLEADTLPARFFRAISRKTRDYYRQRGLADFTQADALATTVLLEPGCVLAQVDRPLAVETAGALARGQSVVDWQRRSGRPDNARVVMTIEQATHRRRLRSALGLDQGRGAGGVTIASAPA